MTEWKQTNDTAARSDDSKLGNGVSVGLHQWQVGHDFHCKSLQLNVRTWHPALQTISDTLHQMTFYKFGTYATVLILDWSTVAEITLFEGGTQIWCTRTGDSVNVGGQNLHC